MNELERADKAYEQSLNVPPSPYVWTMDSDYCDECGIYLFDGGISDDNSGLCSTCFENWLNDMEDDEDEEVTYIGEYDQELYVMPKQTVIVDMEVEGEA